MFYDVVILNPGQANDFIRKYLQDNIKIVKFTKYNDEGSIIYFVTLSSGKLFNKKETSWQFRPYCGLCFGEHVVPMPGTDKRFDFYQFDNSLLDKANEVVRKYIEKWEKVSPV